MPLTAYAPLDPARYRPLETRTIFSPTLPPGRYVYVQNVDGTVWVAPDGSHIHPRISGGVRPVVSAGELFLGEQGQVIEVNNLSGTFQCHPDCLLTAAGGLIRQGASLTADAIVPFEDV